MKRIKNYNSGTTNKFSGTITGEIEQITSFMGRLLYMVNAFFNFNLKHKVDINCEIFLRIEMISG